MPKLLYYLLLILSLSLLACTKQEKADLVLNNGNVYSLSWNDPNSEGIPAENAPFKDGKWLADAEAIAIKNGIIIAVTTNEDITQYIGAKSKVIDLKGATVVPGLIESHGHPQEIGEANELIDLQAVKNEAEIVERVLAASKVKNDSEWLIGYGWDEGAFASQLPSHHKLSQLFPDRPVILKGLRGFSTLANQKAMELAKVDKKTIAPEGGRILKDKSGNLTGVFVDNAKRLIDNLIPKRTLEQRKRILSFGLNELAKNGYVTSHHAGVYKEYMPVYELMADENLLPIRVEAMLAIRSMNKELGDEWTKRGPKSHPSGMLEMRSMKAYYDGSLGSRGAKLIEDYSDQAGHKGVSGDDYGFQEEDVLNAIAAGFQFGIHAIGDQGNRDVIDFYAKAFERFPEAKKMRHRIEHAQIVHPDDFKRLGALNLIASMEPPHAVEDSPWAEERVGFERAKGAYAWRTMRRNNVTLLFNSDLVGSSYNIFYGLHCAITRINPKTKAPWFPEQKVTAEEALRAYTIWPAYASFKDDKTGTLESGKWADISVLSLDILNTGNSEADALLKGEVLMTIVNGKVVYKR